MRERTLRDRGYQVPQPFRGTHLCQECSIVLEGTSDHLLRGVQVRQELTKLHGCGKSGDGW